MVRFVGDRSCIGVVLSTSPRANTYRDSMGIDPVHTVTVLWNEARPVVFGGTGPISEVIEDLLELIESA